MAVPITKICFFSGKRGGFGAYVPLLRLLESDPDLQLQILLGDMHAAEEFGKTKSEVEIFFPTTHIEVMDMGSGRGDSSLIRLENLASCLQQAAQILDRTRPDLVFVHGDRGEQLMMAFAALNLGIMVAHTQGGEISGNIDDIQRRSISKLAHLHFPETELAARRLAQMGEEDWRIHVVGSLYIDRIIQGLYPSPTGILPKYQLEMGERYFIVIFHPDTFESKEDNYQHAVNLLQAVKSFGFKSLVLYPCSDPGYEGVIKAIRAVQSDPQFLVYKNIDNLDFLGLMSQARAIVGNSSCALVEAPYFQLPAINVGRRQMGRDREANVIDAEPTVVDIKAKINYALFDSNFRRILHGTGKRLGDGYAAQKILRVVKDLSPDREFLRKKLRANY